MLDAAALAACRTVDLTSRGRRTGRPLRVEIWWFRVDGRFVITGTPGRRHWYANVLADPHHPVCGSVNTRRRKSGSRTTVATAGRSTPATWMVTYREQADLDDLVRTAPMIEVELAGRQAG